MFEDKRLQDRVASLRLCGQIPSVPGKERVAAYLHDTLFVWAYYWSPGMDQPAWRLMRREEADFTDMPMHPAPLLEEIMEVLPSDVHTSPRISRSLRLGKTRDGRFFVSFKTSSKDHSCVPEASFATKASDAALGMLLQVAASEKWVQYLKGGPDGA